MLITGEAMNISLVSELIADHLLMRNIYKQIVSFSLPFDSLGSINIRLNRVFKNSVFLE